MGKGSGNSRKISKSGCRNWNSREISKRSYSAQREDEALIHLQPDVMADDFFKLQVTTP